MREKLLLLSFAMLTLSGCSLPVAAGAGAATIYMTRPGEAPPPDTEHRIQVDRLWCYRTMGDPECYSHAQDVPPNRLIATEPPREQPTDIHAYREAVLEGR